MTHPVDRIVGQNLRKHRQRVGMTQQQLASRIGIRFQQIQKYESGMNRISASRLWDISVAMEVPVADFFADCDTDQAANGPGRASGGQTSPSRRGAVGPKPDVSAQPGATFR